MTSSPDVPVPLPADLAEALAHLPPGPFTGQVVYYDDIGSTNDVADRVAAAGAPEGLAIVAGSQREGRGRLGRAWFSPPGAGLYVSVVLRPEPPDRARGGDAVAPPGFSVFSLVAGVALAEALRTVSALPVEIKWPNDLVVGRRKVCGILAEASLGPGGPPHLVLGFGINVRVAAYPPELADRATSLEGELGRPLDRGQVLAAALTALGERYLEARRGGIGRLLQRWRELAPSSVGRRVSWRSPEGPMAGETRGIDDDGALLVAVGDRIVRVVAGEVTWL